MSSNFSKIMGYINIMQSRYHRAYGAFNIYDTLMKLSAPNVVGQDEAEQNVKIINDFKDFFHITKEAVRVYFFLELAKMFDTSKRSLQINEVINFTESQLTNLSAKDFTEYNQDRELVNELVKAYDGITQKDLQEIKETLKAQEPVIEKLLTYRNKWLAHDDTEKPEIPIISGEEIEKLFETISKIMNTLGGRLNHETWMWDHVKEYTEQDTKLVIEHLRRFEPYRIKEIYAEADAELEKYKNPQHIKPSANNSKQL